MKGRGRGWRGGKVRGRRGKTNRRDESRKRGKGMRIPFITITIIIAIIGIGCIEGIIRIAIALIPFFPCFILRITIPSLLYFFFHFSILSLLLFILSSPIPSTIATLPVVKDLVNH